MSDARPRSDSDLGLFVGGAVSAFAALVTLIASFPLAPVPALVAMAFGAVGLRRGTRRGFSLLVLITGTAVVVLSIVGMLTLLSATEGIESHVVTVVDE
ncbi:hypothetical protein C1701_16210 [Actinoalloteichus sp. AHMU CJ021]|uniref:DUF4190 domain-containing protein n=1 Tax=Actinoalloteichus caeruleus DSM 43889 TaxID=1120930 RepID=A0ABT1JNI8_ACTCY|nr:hypothetical protein [Actinoalloteichus caeruleus]AUS79637.1 hypothetical protein C1701_16210 [Actinoalloteichus sp. AHMU CJ021]MCP2333829.1 hypothetical protein [Actinoalloteichus caeruleus DSM 43889]